MWACKVAEYINTQFVANSEFIAGCNRLAGVGSYTQLPSQCLLIPTLHNRT